ncbi:gliding motility-associated C-terminal domain-containing protein [Mucilaginibacter rubeus]|uniref:Gliding motility-associated C-terminal domain-containing protein n=1 Tax=Mucilaginibacter rubeus TaxID=2027860 RepID=A0A5C1HUP8_9SPHI|nr:gliding motility-associated C-terminal domain-containing protein [Mucilaginibacter rubeus]QEM09163.1 gliding motility-associated C-terminal domain-containing protein [Mucilaginibacter rubeus]
MILVIFCHQNQYAQGNVQFHVNTHILGGKKILRVKCDFNDPYAWVLAEHNQVYRINSATKKVDDFTAQFSSYHDLTFIDIAGESADTVFIATGNKMVIQYKKGVTNTISAAQGLVDDINSIGVDYSGIFLTETANVLLIGTFNGMFRYNMDTEELILSSHKEDSQIFEATYKKLFHSGTYDSSGPQTGTLRFIPTLVFDDHTYFPGYVWLDGQTFGDHINTAFYTTPTIYDSQIHPNFLNIYWGNDKGMFQIKNSGSYYLSDNYKHYLDNIQVNKITSIYGLTAFGDGHAFFDAGLIKENMLIGTDQGLYYSTAMYDYYGNNNQLNEFTLSHFDELGNIRVNDISVYPKSTREPVCEDGFWLATDDGLYFVKPDYAAALNNQQAKLISFENEPYDPALKRICEGNEAHLLADQYNDGNAAVQWYRNGQELPGESGVELVTTKPGDYYAVLYDPCQNFHFESNHLKVEVISAPIFSFNYPDHKQYCGISEFKLETDYSQAYHYRWYKDGELLDKTDNFLLVNENGTYKVEVSACDGTWVPSKETGVEFINLPEPKVIPDKFKYCEGETAHLNSGVPPDDSYNINWYRDGEPLTENLNKQEIEVVKPGSYTVKLTAKNGDCFKVSEAAALSFTPLPHFTFDYPDVLSYCNEPSTILKTTLNPSYQYRWYKDGVLNGITGNVLTVTASGLYALEVSSCEGSWVGTKNVQVNLARLPNPQLTADKTSYCTGDIAKISAGISPSADYAINWTNNGVPLPEWDGHSTINATAEGRYRAIVTSTLLHTCFYVSTEYALTFNPEPGLTLERSTTQTLCDGQLLTVRAVYNEGSIRWSDGQSTDLITITRPGNYGVGLTSTTGCYRHIDFDINFYALPVINIPDAVICPSAHQTIILTADEGYSTYLWNGVKGGSQFSVDRPQIVQLTVIDNNGCQATKQITVSEQCQETSIPNTFTPNGDGINDTWVIPPLESVPDVSVQVFNRYGTKVYQSNGLYTPWNGRMGTKRLPAGTYYYIISEKKAGKKFSGNVTLIY